jgi:hypothetical protein
MFEQLTLHEAMERGREASEACADNAGPDFQFLAKEFVREFFRTKRMASAEEATLACIEKGIRPHDLRAFGSVYRSLVSEGAIRKAGECSRKFGHGSRGGSIYVVNV